MPDYLFACDECGEKRDVSLPCEERDEYRGRCRNGHDMKRRMTYPMAIQWSGKFHSRWNKVEQGEW